MKNRIEIQSTDDDGSTTVRVSIPKVEYQRATMQKILLVMQEGLIDHGSWPTMIAMPPIQRVAGLPARHWFRLPLASLSLTVEITSDPEQEEMIPCWPDPEVDTIKIGG